MKFTKTGLILNTENYEACRVFYGSVLGLPLERQFSDGEDEITVFSLGSSYLMVEKGGVAHTPMKSTQLCPTKFRFNVEDVHATAEALKARGVDVTVREYDWGTTAEFADPDGNRCALRSEKDFEDE